MKRALILSFALFSVCVLSAQTDGYRNVGPFEGEVGVGGIFESDGYYRGNTVPGFSIFIEGRHNFRNSAMSIGLQGFFGQWDRKDLPIADAGPGPFNERLRPLMVTIYGDYNFRRWKNVSLFAGGGVGGAYFTGHSWSSNRYILFSPRIGVELFSRFRLTVDLKTTVSDYTFFGINAGYVFGGKP